MDPQMVANLARAYLYAIGRGMSSAAARTYASTEFGGNVTSGQMNRVVGQANQARQTGQALNTLDPTDPLWLANRRFRGSDAYVGVRVNMTVTMESGFVRTLTMYVRMRWDSTVEDIHDAAFNVVSNLVTGDSKPVSSVINYYGATLWDVPSSYLQWQ
jgi:hypothetical protein